MGASLKQHSNNFWPCLLPILFGLSCLNKPNIPHVVGFVPQVILGTGMATSAQMLYDLDTLSGTPSNPILQLNPKRRGAPCVVQVSTRAHKAKSTAQVPNHVTTCQL